MREIVRSELPDRAVHSLFQDHRGRIWVSTVGGVGYLENDRFISISSIGRWMVQSIAEDTRGNLWFADQNLGLVRVVEGRVVDTIPWATLGRQDSALSLVADSRKGGLWIGFRQSGLAYFADGQIRASFTSGDGLGEGIVSQLRLDADGTLWAATEGGLSRLKDGRLATLTGRNGLPCDSVHWLIEDDARTFWLNTPCGLLRIARSELDAWAAEVDKAGSSVSTIHATVLDSYDGVRIRAFSGGFNQRVAKSLDGRLWFPTLDGVSIVDPRRLAFNKLPPPVHIEQVVPDRKIYDASIAGAGPMRLPPLVRDLEIDYTALSLAAPEKVLFRYKLEGYDRDWQEAANRRQAFYSNLWPGKYRFHVSACNNSGVWNEAGVFLDFAVAPAYYQTTWFRVACVAAFLSLAGAIYQRRLRQVEQRFNLRLEERVSERTRIARDLHDTLLQSFQGVLMKFHAVTYMIPVRTDARNTLETVIEQARKAIVEGRNAVQGLRSSTVVTNDLAQAIGAVGEELAACAGQNCPEFRLRVEGESRDLAPLVRDDVHRIASEALRNAFRHAQAGRIEVEIHYERRRLRLRVLDNGKGIDQKTLVGGGRPGHFGLAGMHERAKLVGGKLIVSSRLEAGTEAELTIPASIAYAKSAAERRSMASGIENR